VDTDSPDSQRGQSPERPVSPGVETADGDGWPWEWMRERYGETRPRGPVVLGRKAPLQLPARGEGIADVALR
jgi:hypothetical protein